MHQSVKEIKDECLRLIDIAESIKPRIDIHTAVCNLRSSMDAMIVGYDSDDYKEDVVASLKEKCELDAVTLEYYMTGFDNSLNTRYKNRVEIVTLFNDITKRFQDINSYSKPNRNDLCMVLTARSVVKKIAAKAGRINFELTQKEVEDIKEVKALIESKLEEMK